MFSGATGVFSNTQRFFNSTGVLGAGGVFGGGDDSPTEDALTVDRDDITVDQTDITADQETI